MFSNVCGLCSAMLVVCAAQLCSLFMLSYVCCLWSAMFVVCAQSCLYNSFPESAKKKTSTSSKLEAGELHKPQISSDVQFDKRQVPKAIISLRAL